MNRMLKITGARARRSGKNWVAQFIPVALSRRSVSPVSAFAVASVRVCSGLSSWVLVPLSLVDPTIFG
jgi:hypothetical protein